MANNLENRRQRIRNLIALALADRNDLKAAQGYYLLNEVNKRLAVAYSKELGAFSNLY